ncbi:hypothetical protein AQUCO_01700282v1 [Aquilegia coerulea]|uniref:Uncharacterized protein n=1 Tax=Aquilegia coerulea TaxID=218851 RepID=A0A2G5DM23_AQUCA|nr:hypothetical protein AQUCO_01700282v1 [Aquilegia coerulea]
MADYRHYMNGGYKSHEKNMVKPRYDRWDNTSNGYETHSPGWGKTGFANNSEGHHDHVCKPVILDAQGRKRPIVSYVPTPNPLMDGTVTKTETIVEQVHVHQVRYGESSPTKLGQTKGYGVHNNGWSQPLSPSHVQTEGIPVGSTYWRQTHNSNGYNGPNSYGGSYDHGSNGWKKPSGKATHDPYFGGYQGKHQMEHDGSQESTIITSGGWVRPSHLGWAIPPNKDIPLTRPTNDIGAAINYLQDAMKHTPVSMAPAKPWATIPTPTVPTIDSGEARRRYGSFSDSPQAIKTTDRYSSTIDSRKAVRRYGGQMM